MSKQGAVSGAGVGLHECRRFCVGRSTKGQQRSPIDRCSAPTTSTIGICDLHSSIGFNSARNLVRGPGGRRFKSSLPDHSFQAHKRYFCFSVYIDGVETVDGACITDFLANLQRELQTDVLASTLFDFPIKTPPDETRTSSVWIHDVPKSTRVLALSLEAATQRSNR